MIPSHLSARVRSACFGAISAWGQEPQFRQAQEEAGELVAAVNHMLRGRTGGFEEAVEETADLILCVAQLRLMLGEEVDRKLEEKLGRLESRVAEARRAL